MSVFRNVERDSISKRQLRETVKSSSRVFTTSPDVVVNTANEVIYVATCTTANITLSGEQTINGYSALDGDLVLVKSQTTGTQNGVYVVSAGSWTELDINYNNIYRYVVTGGNEANKEYTLLDKPVNDVDAKVFKLYDYKTTEYVSETTLDSLDIIGLATKTILIPSLGSDFFIAPTLMTIEFINWVGIPSATNYEVYFFDVSPSVTNVLHTDFTARTINWLANGTELECKRPLDASSYNFGNNIQFGALNAGAYDLDPDGGSWKLTVHYKIIER